MAEFRITRVAETFAFFTASRLAVGLAILVLHCTWSSLPWVKEMGRKAMTHLSSVVVKKALNYPPTVWYVFVFRLLIRGKVTFRFWYLRELKGKSGQYQCAMFKEVLHLAYTYVGQYQERHIKVRKSSMFKLRQSH